MLQSAENSSWAERKKKKAETPSQAEHKKEEKPSGEKPHCSYCVSRRSFPGIACQLHTQKGDTSERAGAGQEIRVPRLWWRLISSRGLSGDGIQLEYGRGGRCCTKSGGDKLECAALVGDALLNLKSFFYLLSRKRTLLDFWNSSSFWSTAIKDSYLRLLHW